MKTKHPPTTRNGGQALHGRPRTARAQADQCFAQANAMLARGKFADAIRKYVEALEHWPEFPEALCNMGSALTRLKRAGSAQAAIECFERAIAIAPTYALAHNNLGAALADSGRLDLAMGSYRRAVELSPEYLDARSNLAGALLRLGHSGEAIAEYERILARDRSNISAREALLSLSDLLQIESRSAEAERICAFLVQRNPNDWEAQVRLALLTPVILDCAAIVENIRGRITESLAHLVSHGIHFNDPFRQYGKTNFYLAYHGRNDREIQKTIAEFHSTACPALRWTAPHCLQPRARNSRLRVGVVGEYLDGHTIGKLYGGMVEEMSHQRFEIVLMRARRDADASTREIDSFAERVVEFPRSLYQARETIAAQQCDVIFYPEIGMDELTYYLAFARLAPTQCVSWGHPVTTGISSIDYFISAQALEPPGADTHYSEHLIRLSALPTCYLRPQRPELPLERERLGAPPDASLYLCPQSLFKLHPDFDAALAAILGEGRRARILLIRGRQPNWETALKARLTSTLADAVERVTFLPPLDQQDFFRMLMTVDVMLDPFHFGGGNSTYEALAMGTPIVTLPGNYMRGRVTSACYQRMGITDLIAADAASYAELAIRVANDRDLRANLSAEILRRCEVLYGDRAVIRELEEFFVAADSAARHGTTLDSWPPRTETPLRP